MLWRPRRSRVENKPPSRLLTSINSWAKSGRDATVRTFQTRPQTDLTSPGAPQSCQTSAKLLFFLCSSGRAAELITASEGYKGLLFVFVLLTDLVGQATIRSVKTLAGYLQGARWRVCAIHTVDVLKIQPNLATQVELYISSCEV